MFRAIPYCLIVCVLLGKTYGYSSGAGSYACSSLRPFHIAQSASQEEPPVDFVFSENDDGTVKVKISAVDFKGFLLQAREPGSTDPIGQFSTNDNTQPLCTSSQGSGLTHSNANLKQAIETVWTPPADNPEDIEFVATVVFSYGLFWTNMKAQKEHEPSPSSGCGTTKGCFRSPPACEYNDCEYFSSWKVVDETLVHFELAAKNASYVAFSVSEDQLMGSDDGVACLVSNGSVKAEFLTLPGHYAHLQGESDELQLLAGRSIGGGVECSFSRPVVSGISAFPVSNLLESRYVFLSRGEVHSGSNGDMLMVHSMDYQSPAFPVVSSVPTSLIDLTDL